jgi:hypothetical protein
VRRICRDACCSARPIREDDRCGNLGGEPAAAARATAALPGCLRLHRVRPTGCAARARPLYPRRRRSPDRRRLCVHRLAVSALALRTTVHARHLPPGLAWPGGRAVGAEGGRRVGESRRGCADSARRGHDERLSQAGGGFRRPEPCASGARRGRRAQRHARVADPGGGAGAGGPQNRHTPRARGGAFRFDELREPPRDGRPACPRHRREGLRRARATVRDACPRRMAGAGARRGERTDSARTAGARRGRRLWHACLRLPGSPGRATAIDRHAQPAGGDGSLARPRRDTDVVARPVRGRLSVRFRAYPVAHRARG